MQINGLCQEFFFMGLESLVDDKSQNRNRTHLFHTHMLLERPMSHFESFARRSHTFPEARTHLIHHKAQPSQREITTRRLTEVRY